MPTLLEKLNLEELSLVDEPANADAKVTIFKRNSDEKEEAESLGVTETDNQLEKSNMSEENKVSVEELQKSLADVTKQNEELAAKLAEAESLSKMSDAEKAYMEKMSDKEKEDWKTMSPEERKRRMGEMKKNDETVEIDGQSISKSAVGEAQFAIFKAQAKKIEALEKSAREAVEKAELVGFAKTAREEYGNLPGSDEEKAYLLKAAASLDENVQNTLNSILKAANKANAGAFETIGKKSSETSNEEEVLEKKAEEIAKRDNISKEQAIRKALEENPELYKG